MFDGMFDGRIATSSNIIDKIRKLQTKIAAKEVAMVVILSELADSDDEKPTRGPTRSWIQYSLGSFYRQMSPRFHCWFFCTANGF